MEPQDHSRILHQIQDALINHLEMIQNYVDLEIQNYQQSFDLVVESINYLSYASLQPVEAINNEEFAFIATCYHRASKFLNLVTAFSKFHPATQEINAIWMRINTWYQQLCSNFNVSMTGIWDYISPAHPDHLVKIDGHSFEAIWAYPVPCMDIEILRHTDGITFQSPVFEPDDMPGGKGVRFCIAPEVLVEYCKA